MTLLTRGKKEVTYQIPDDTDESYNAYKSAVKHIAADRKDKSMLDSKLAGKKFDGGSGKCAAVISASMNKLAIFWAQPPCADSKQNTWMRMP